MTTPLPFRAVSNNIVVGTGRSGAAHSPRRVRCASRSSTAYVTLICCPLEFKGRKGESFGNQDGPQIKRRLSDAGRTDTVDDWRGARLGDRPTARVDVANHRCGVKDRGFPAVSLCAPCACKGCPSQAALHAVEPKGLASDAPSVAGNEFNPSPRKLEQWQRSGIWRWRLSGAYKVVGGR